MSKQFTFKTSERFRWTDLVIGILFMISLLAVGLYIAVNLRPLYYLNISWNDLPASSGYNAVIIRENYDALIVGTGVYPLLRKGVRVLSGGFG